MRGEKCTVTVLIVEDEMIPAEYLKSIIEASGVFCVIDIVSSAQEALQVAKREKPDIVFMDIMLKGAKSGAELALQLHYLYREMLIIFMTAYSTEEMVAYAVESDAFAYLLKPYRAKEINATLRLAQARLDRTFSTDTSAVVMLVDGFYYRTDTHRLYREGKAVALTSNESALIRLLCENRDLILEKETIQRHMSMSDVSLRSLIYRVRKQTSRDLIQSVKRLGYRIATA